MSKTYEFVIKCVGTGDDPGSAWKDALEYLFQSLEEYTPISKSDPGAWCAPCAYELESENDGERT